jgi:hypothetical protein
MVESDPYFHEYLVILPILVFSTITVAKIGLEKTDLRSAIEKMWRPSGAVSGRSEVVKLMYSFSQAMAF